jgi:transcriptional regulator with XRE-family HTH domain
VEYLELRKVLKKHRLTLKAFSQILGLNEQTVRQWKKIGIPQYAITNVELFERLSSEEREKFLQERLIKEFN